MILAATEQPAVAVERLVKRYKATLAVDDISFALRAGSITGLLGGNGAGKTTTIAMIMGLVTPTSGTVTRARRRHAARALPRAAADEFRKPLRRHADAAHGAAKSLGLCPALRASPITAARIESLAAELDLTEFLDRPTGKLSSGQKTRVSLAKALLNHPEVLLLDEPTASLDPDTADWVRGHLEDYTREHKATVLLASHNMGEVERLCERVIIMKKGRIEDDDTPERLLARYGRETLEEVFLDVARGRARAGGGAMTDSGFEFSANRVAAMVRRYWYLLRSSWPRILDLIYWPTVQMLMWGFLQLYVSQSSSMFARAGGVFIGAVLLWDILFRGQLGFSISFLEEMYSHNLANLMMSPLRPVEFIAALMIMSIVRLLIGMIPVTAARGTLLRLQFLVARLPLIAFFINLILTSWAIGVFVAGLLLRNGLGAESMAWTIMFLFLPLTCVYYPVTVLPHWLQYVAWSLPPTYVFEGMRALLIEHVFRADLMLTGLRVQCGAVRSRIVRLHVACCRAPVSHGSLLQGGE